MNNSAATSSSVTSIVKHTLHCALMFTVIYIAQCFTSRTRSKTTSANDIVYDEVSFTTSYPNDEDVSGDYAAQLMFVIRLVTVFALPSVLFNFFGLLLFNAFANERHVPLTGSPLLAPFLCIRIVTRGDFPDLVRSNVRRNVRTCLDSGLESFVVEVVTDRSIGGIGGSIGDERYARETVVPAAYQSRRGALFKARALQYCLEDGVNALHDEHWIVHLDEETLLTTNSVRGIVNFIVDGRHAFGQGLITYANGNDRVVNWLTTLADCSRVSEDMGKIRFQFRTFNRPLFSWKGSFVVSLVRAERDVSFDNGPDGSIAEDCYFALRAFSLGYTFGFIEGEMHEKSPFTLWDFVQQRKRWLQGIMLVVRAKEIPWRNKAFVALNMYLWCWLPVLLGNIVISLFVPITIGPHWLELVFGFLFGMQIYGSLFGMLKTLSLQRIDWLKGATLLVAVICVIPLNMVLETVAVLLGVFGRKRTFHVVQKATSSRSCEHPAGRHNENCPMIV